mmetsp:Transcript_35187/g.84046  ORF Transcript_35187/g.84046 Transcript_35187/m.84046 type:complete len:208 (-) Transcript_35187:769-1392(-)
MGVSGSGAMVETSQQAGNTNHGSAFSELCSKRGFLLASLYIHPTPTKHQRLTVHFFGAPTRRLFIHHDAHCLGVNIQEVHGSVVTLWYYSPSRVFQPLQAVESVLFPELGGLVVPEHSLLMIHSHSSRLLKVLANGVMAGTAALVGRFRVPLEGLRIVLLDTTAKLVAQSKFCHGRYMLVGSRRLEPLERRHDVDFDLVAAHIGVFV